jgi:hypothetical protein
VPCTAERRHLCLNHSRLAARLAFAVVAVHEGDSNRGLLCLVRT